MVWVLSIKQKIIRICGWYFLQDWNFKRWCSSGVYSGAALVLVYVNDLTQLLSKSDSYRCGDDTCVFYQEKDIPKIVGVLTRRFSTLNGWLFNNTLSIHFGEYQTKCPLFSKTKRSSKLNIANRNYNIKQCHTVEYLGNILILI